jgi:hypothetical protein
MSYSEEPTRRHFLRRAGLMGAVTAAFIGGADLAGIPAHASVRSNKQRTSPDTGCCIDYTWAPGHCGTCPSGECCFHAVGCNANDYLCVASSNCADFGRCT